MTNTHPPGKLLICCNDTPDNLVRMKQFISLRDLTRDDVKLTRLGKMLELRAVREVRY